MEKLCKNAVLSFVIFWFCLLDDCSLELNRRVLSVALERPRVVDVNHDLARVINVTSRRHGRSDKTHYIQLWVEYYKYLDNSSGITVNVYEFLSNDYRPTFVGMKLKFCDFLGQFLKMSTFYYTRNISMPLQPLTFEHCYFNPGIYYYPNFTLPLVHLPDNFPFVKGRVFVNHTYKGKLVMAGSIDLELKTVPARKYKGRPSIIDASHLFN